jgi:hypothetical protein
MPSEYFRRVLTIWLKKIAGPVAALCAVILPIAGVAFHLSPIATTWLGVTPLLLAILLTWPAHYELWKEVGEKREEPEARKERQARKEQQMPEVSEPRPQIDKPRIEGAMIQGELSGFRLSGNPGESRTGNSWRCYANAACKLYVCNSNPVKATIKDLVIDGSALDPPAEFTQVTFLRGADKVLEQGIGVNCEVLLRYAFKGFQWKQIGRVELKNVKVYAVDSFGAQHLISVPPGESLPTP